MPAVGAISASVNFDVSQFIANAKKMSSEALKSFAGIKETADNTNKTLGGLNSTLAKLNLQLQNVQIGSKEFKSLQAEIAKTQNQINSATSTSGKFGQISELAGQAGFNGMQLFSAGIKGAAVALAGLALSKSITLGLAFEKQMSEVGAAANATGKDFDALSERARKLGATTSFSATQAAQGMTELAKAGLTTNQVLVGTEAVLNLAKAGSIGLAEAATIAADTMSQFGLAAEDLNRISDLLAKSANASTISVFDMGETLKYVGGVAKSAGISIEQVSAATALLGNAGIKASMAGTSLKTIIMGLSAPSKEGEKALRAIGLSMQDLQDKDGSLKKLPEIFDLLKKKTEALSKTKRTDIFKDLFGAESVTAGLALMDAAGEKYNAMVDEMEKNSVGFAKKYGDALSNNVQGKLDNLSSGMEEVFLKIWDAIKPIVSLTVSLTNSIVNVGGAILGSLLKPFRELFEFTQPFFAWLIAILDEFAMKLVNIDPLFVAIKESMFPLMELFREIGSIANEFWKIIVNVADEISTLFAIFNTGGDSIFTPLVQGIKEFWSYLTEVSPLVFTLKALFAPLVLAINAMVFSARAFIELFKVIGNLAVSAWNKFKDLLGVLSNIGEIINKILSGKFSLSFDIGDMTQKVLDAFNFDSIKNFFSNGFTGVWNNLLSLATEFWEKFLSITKGAVNAIKDYFKNQSPDIATQMQAYADKVEQIKKGRAKPTGIKATPMTPVASGGKPLKEDSGVSELQPIFARVKENVGGIADQKGTIKLIADLKSQLKDIEQSSVLFGSKFQQSLASVAVKIKAVGAVMQEFGKAFTDILAATAQLKQVKFDNFKQNLSFVANAMSKLVDDGLKATIDSINAETNARAKGYDEQLAAFTDAKKKEQDAQKEHDLQMQLLKAEMDAKAKAENDALFQEQAEKLNAEYQAQIDQINAQTTNATEAAASEQALLAQQEEAKIALRQQFDQRLIEQQDLNKQTIDEKNAAYDAERKAREEKADKDKQAIEEAKQTFLAEQENKRTQAQDRAAKEKEAIQKRTALIEWQVGKGAFEANKQSQRAAIQMNMGMMVMNATAGVLASFAKGGTEGAVIGGIMAVALTAMGLAATATSLAAVSAAQYPPPPVFAEGGIVPGSSFSGDKVPAMVNSGEMILNQSQQAKLFEQANGKGGGVGTTNIYLDGVKVQNMTNASPDMIADQVGRIIRQSTYQAVTR